jgi:hypothetical protein
LYLPCQHGIDGMILLRSGSIDERLPAAFLHTIYYVLATLLMEY